MSKWPISLQVVVISILLGGASGIVAAVMTGNYLSDYSELLREMSGPLRLADERPHALPETLEDAVTMVREQALPSSAFIHRTADAMGVYNPAEADAAAAVVTSDGWLMTFTDVLS